MSKRSWLLSSLLSVVLVSGVASAARGPLSPAAASPSGAGVLAYEGLVSKQRTWRGTETQLSTCSASVVNLPGVGPKLVTAAHCSGTEPVFFDERGRMKPSTRHAVPAGPDVAVFDLAGASPWRALAVRDSATLRQGEPLCAFRTTRASSGVSREKVCGTFVGRTMAFASGGRALLAVDHPFQKGTSGSPLLDSAGRVVGVVVSTTQSQGFAEPIEQASRAALAAPTSTRDNPAPVSPSDDGGLFGDIFPRAGSLCFFGTCVRWEL